tara:strand:+ start:4580 stop:5050 length:471 start_codon:yes stop_codon:yes gene_type:complete
MAHYALLDENNIVINVIVGRDETDTDALPEGFSDWEAFYLSRYDEATSVKRTSYNTFSYKHYDGEGNLSEDQSKAFRGNFAAVGNEYDPTNDVFVANGTEWNADEGKYLPPKQHASYILDDNNYWKPPIPVPDNENAYTWNDEAYQADNTQGWELA